MIDKNIILGAIGIAVLIIVGVWQFNRDREVELVDDVLLSAGEVKIVTADEASEFLLDQDVFLLDVHVPEQVHIPGTDAVIPYDKVTDNIDQLPVDTDTPILVYCRSGGMSRPVSVELVQMGYTNVYDLVGGMNAYKKSNVAIVIDPLEQDLGEVVYGEVSHAEFTLTNFTPETLTITRVSTSCGCTQAEVGQKVLQPYESTIVSVSFDPAVHGDDTDLGDLTREIYINTDNLNYSQITMRILASVIREN